MKKVLIIALLLMLGVGLIFSTSVNANDYEYLNSKIIIEAYESGVFSNEPLIGMTEYTSDVSWNVYQGNREIDESEFLKIIGLDEEAEKAEEHKIKKRNYTVGGILATTIGGTVALYQAEKADSPSWQNEEPNMALVIGGTGLMIAGAAYYVRGYNMSDQYLNLNYAKSLAENYNQRLKEKMSLEPTFSFSKEEVSIVFNKSF